MILRGVAAQKRTNGLLVVKAVEAFLSDATLGPMVQSLDLSQNAGIEDSELAYLTQALITLTRSSSKNQLSTLKALNISQIGASPSALCNFIKALPQITRFHYLDLSGNTLAFFCADALVTALKAIESETPSSKKRR